MCHPHQLIGIALEDQHRFQLFAVIAIDLLWMARNFVVHEGKLCGVQELASRVGKLSCDHWHAWQQKNALVQEKYVWKAPPNGKVKVNVDVAIRD